jgi:hypothetical protein
MDSICPKCVGAKQIMEPNVKPKVGFTYNTCTLCNGVGFVNSELEEDFLLSLNEDNFDIE